MEEKVKVAVSRFQAARVGHDKRWKSAAALELAKAAAEYLSAGGETPDDREKLLQGLALMVTDPGK